MIARVNAFTTRLANDQAGVTMLEYSILIGIITASVITLVVGAGSFVTNKWTALSTAGVK